MEHAFPPPFRWASGEGCLFLVLAGGMVAAAVTGLVATLRAKPHTAHVVAWCVFGIGCVFFGFRTPESISHNWRHVAAVVPVLMWCGGMAVAMSVCAIFCDIVRGWRAGKYRESGELSLGFLVLIGLAAVLLPAFSGPWRNSPFSRCKNNLKQIGLALHNYHDNHRMFAVSRISDPPTSWRIHLLPYVDQESLYLKYDQEQAWDSKTNCTCLPGR